MTNNNSNMPEGQGFRIAGVSDRSQQGMFLAASTPCPQDPFRVIYDPEIYSCYEVGRLQDFLFFGFAQNKQTKKCEWHLICQVEGEQI